MLDANCHQSLIMYILIPQVDVPGLSSASLLEVGPVSMSFELPKQTCTGLQIRFLRLSPTQTGLSQRWVRYVTHSDSYTIRIWPNQMEQTFNMYSTSLGIEETAFCLTHPQKFISIINILLGNQISDNLCIWTDLQVCSFYFFDLRESEQTHLWRYNSIVSRITK